MLSNIHSDRLLLVPGAINFRDMGGYATSDGRKMKWRTLFRSGDMHGVSVPDAETLQALGITTIYDLRTNDERTRNPTQWQCDTVAYHYRDHDQSLAELEEMIAKGVFTDSTFQEIINKAYKKLPIEQASSYRHLFRLLVEGRTPLLFNCAAGKDRTGIAAALILHVLGVPRAVIDEDYQLTELAIEDLVAMLRRDPLYAPILKQPRELYLPILRAQPAYLQLALDQITARHGSIDSYLETELGVGRAEKAALRNNLLE